MHCFNRAATPKTQKNLCHSLWDYRDSFTDPIRQLETELDELNTQRRDTQELKKSMDFLDSLGISFTADEAMVARIHQQAAADSDYDNDQDNWLDNAAEGEGPEL